MTPYFILLPPQKAHHSTPDEAAALDDKLISAWTGHPHLRIIGNNTGFEGKMQRLLSEIASFLGEPQPHEIRRKYLIEYPDIAGLESMPNCSRVEIIQTYLRSADNTQTRIRQRGAGRQYIYSKTETRIIPGSNPIETESRLSQDEYLHLLMQADTSMRQLRKTRYCLTYENQYFEIDIYPFWHDKAILEIAVCSENDIICLPQFFHVIRDITGDPSYSSRSLSAGEQQH